MRLVVVSFFFFDRVFGVRREGNVDPAVDVHGELTSQNVLFKAETVKAASQALGVSDKGWARGRRARARGGGKPACWVDYLRDRAITSTAE